MKILIVSNTYYQLIMAIQLRMTLFRDAEVDLWISDQSVGAEEVAKRLAEKNIFSQVYFKERKKTHSTLNSHKKTDSIKYAFKYNFGKAVIETTEIYDEILFYNLEMPLYAIADYYKQQGHKCQWSKYEEGILSYENDFAIGNKLGRLALTEKIRSVTGRPRITQLVKKYYCMFPEFKKTHREDWEFVKIPPIGYTRNELCRILNYAFRYEAENISQKYIFFASSLDIDGCPTGETELILQIARTVGTDNFIVKLHPRDTRSIYQENGITVMKNSFVPWEVMHMNMIEEKRVLLTATSGAFLGSSAMLDSSMTAIYLFPCLKCEAEYFLKIRQEIRDKLHVLHENYLCSNVRIYGEDN
ncbi:hypothetical protein [Acetatifactor muris]|uniref:hypothetical protein n=1 Tax=Acetatifactor muris TaxID=879566 RepID=UPI0023F3D8C5|nr:hypothetical protein [Acetatifactor muris]MCI8798663.1 hypothetical protein [Lachnospiraceae bacterium]